ncbi:ATP-dependent DNA helicase [Peptostreptococcus sp. MV1]|uniref:ATP-dependent helicase n=1 Tax=Peptostreptococcus sp. MV1 TaxID=1219626 RepID=UPI00050F268A|nr:ATP-dependent helicase [Peptostreptococcus sp. MV1]KGF10542.1 ATP-dependent DNA helicase [Peptostreptococcus sp. MV1]
MVKLNKNQAQAVAHIDGPCMVLAGPGSGKTRVISQRIVSMVLDHAIPPTRILAISFTKASSVEMKKRTLGYGQDKRLKKVSFGTFHSSFFRILRRYAGVGLDDLLVDIDRFKLVKSILKYLKVTNYNDDDVADLLNEISLVKNELLDYRDYESLSFDQDTFQKAYRIYEDEKKKYGKIDFDDMLIRAYDLLRAEPAILNIVRQVFRYILIDEFQDINKVQFELIRLVAGQEQNVFVVGDEDQSIYGFRGARPDFMLEFDEYFPGAKHIYLDINYRSCENIVDLSASLIKKNKLRHDKMIRAFSKESARISYIYPRDTDDEARLVAGQIFDRIGSQKDASYGDFAVIYRTNRQARAFVDAFMNKRIPFILKDAPKTIYDHWVSLDLIAYLRIAMDIGSSGDWVRVINKPFRYISKNSLAKAERSVDFFDALLNDEDIKDFQKKNLEDLYEDLNYVRGLSPQYGISYIRTTLDYDRYILEYCHERKIRAQQIVEILDELESAASNYKTILDFFKHIDQVREEVKKSSDKTTGSSLATRADEGVVLTTMHSSKGLEFESVYIVGVNEGVIPYQVADEARVDIEEERRLFYVAITRSKKELVISSPLKRFGKKVGPSMFLKDLQENRRNLKGS